MSAPASAASDSGAYNGGERVTAWSPCGPGHQAARAACVPWSRVFDPADVR